jgi:hypothetical protein
LNISVLRRLANSPPPSPMRRSVAWLQRGWSTFGVHVRIEAVLVGRRLVPRGARLFLDKADLHDRLGRLEAVLPRHHQAHRRAVLVGQHLAVHAEGQQRERVHGLVHAQAFGVGPVEHARADERHGLGVGQRHELDELGVALRLDLLDQFGQRVADPWNHHRPALDAAQAVDALFLRAELQQVFDAVLARLLDQPFDFHRPGPRLQRAGVLGGVGLVGAELVVVVVGRRVLVVGDLFHRHGTGHRRLRTRQWRELVGALGCARLRATRKSPAPHPRHPRHELQQVATAFVDGTRRDLARQRVNEAVVAAADAAGADRTGMERHDRPFA